MGRKLVVQVLSAHDLMPKDGRGSASAFCSVEFQDTTRHTQVKIKDLDPSWNEKFEFDVKDAANMATEVLEICVYREGSSGRGRDEPSFLGRVTILGSSFVKEQEKAIVTYHLERRSIFFSGVRGEMRLMIWYYDEAPPSAGPGNKEKTVAATEAEAKASVSRPTPPTVVAAADHEYVLRDTTPVLASITGEKVIAYDLVEKMQYLYVRVVKAKSLSAKDANGSSDPYVTLKIGEGMPAETMVIPKTLNPEWNQTFAFNADKIQGPWLEMTVWDKDTVSSDDFLGSVTIELLDVPTRFPPDSALAPSWYRLEEKTGETRVKGEIMLAVWWGTQADEAFTEAAWHSDTGDQHHHTKSKVYLSPKLWYLRISVIEAQDLLPLTKNRHPEVSVKVQLGIQITKTKVSPIRNTSPHWAQDDLLFVAAEPFEEPLIMTVDDRVAPNKEEVLGVVKIPLSTIEMRVDGRLVASKWYNLEKNGDRRIYRGRIHLRACFDGGYHVMEESSQHISDMRPTAKQLWKNPLGMLELGIISGKNFLPMKTKPGGITGVGITRGTTDAYCVAKYGPKWVRTRTMLDSFDPKWNEQYTWEVYDPCTVLTVGVFDNCHLMNVAAEKAAEGKDLRIGKVRIRLSTLESDRVYTHSYPLLMLQASGVMKMGEIELAVRFSCASFLNVLQLYFKPPLPKMHYRHPLSVSHVESLRHVAIKVISMRLSRSEPPLPEEVVQYMLDVDSNLFSIRRSRAHYVYRLLGVFSGILAMAKWFEGICKWTNPITTILVHVLFVILIWYPQLIMPTFFLCMCLIGAWQYRYRTRAPSSMDAKLSHAMMVDLDELDGEFDSIATSRATEITKARYEKLMRITSRIETILEDLASQGERFHALISCRDPRATSIFLTFCLIAAIVLYVTPFQVLALIVGIYTLRHPRFRNNLPPLPLNFLEGFLLQLIEFYKFAPQAITSD